MCNVPKWSHKLAAFVEKVCLTILRYQTLKGYTAQKIKFSIKDISINVTKSVVSCRFGQILNGKLHFLCSETSSGKLHFLCSETSKRLFFSFDSLLRFIVNIRNKPLPAQSQW